MAFEQRKHSKEDIGSLRECLVEGNAEQLLGERRLRRRSLALSLILQATILAAVILVPLLVTTDRIALANTAPTPIYTYGGGSPTLVNSNPLPPGGSHTPCHFCVPPRVPTGIRPAPPTVTSGEGEESNWPPGVGPVGPQIPGAVQLPSGGQARPAPPRETTPATPRVVKKTHLDPAMLIHRVEPIYPTIPQQMRLSGRVELRAIISTNGSIQSLEVFSGSPLFFQSALIAVRQWRYRPTILNGQPVEVETIITVIYHIQ